MSGKPLGLGLPLLLRIAQPKVPATKLIGRVRRAVRWRVPIQPGPGAGGGC